jgi:hypothetical protein
VKSEEEPTARPAHEPTKQVKNATQGLRVGFPDGTVVWQQAAIDTFISALRKIGLERIPPVGIMHAGYNLVSKEARKPEPNRIWQHACDGWYVYTNISNATKIQHLKRISDFYNLSLIIEEGKPKAKRQK